MNSDFMQFLRANENGMVWFAIPGGLISGKLDKLDIKTHVFGLRGAAYHTGSFKLDLGDSSVLADDVSAWGLSMPTLLAEEETD